jgi:hypothetical protein
MKLCFGGTYRLHLQGKKYVEQETIVQQVTGQNYTALYPKSTAVRIRYPTYLKIQFGSYKKLSYF